MYFVENTHRLCAKFKMKTESHDFLKDEAKIQFQHIGLIEYTRY
jgi:hypothetical protein